MFCHLTEGHCVPQMKHNANAAWHKQTYTKWTKPANTRSICLINELKTTNGIYVERFSFFMLLILKMIIYWLWSCFNWMTLNRSVCQCISRQQIKLETLQERSWICADIFMMCQRCCSDWSVEFINFEKAAKQGLTWTQTI